MARHAYPVELGSVEVDEGGTVVALKKGKEIKLDKWMKSNFVSFDSSASFVDEKGRKYKWKGCAPEETLEISKISSLRLASSIRPPKFHAQNHGTGTIAHFQPQEDGRSKLAQIHVNPQSGVRARFQN